MTKTSPVRQFFRNPVKTVGFALAAAVAKSVPNNWFLRGDDGPSSGPGTSLGDPYAESSWVFAALNLIADPITSAKLKILTAPGGELINDATLDAFWTEPARSAHEKMGMEMLLALSVMCRGVHGRAFWVMDDSWLAASPMLYQPLIVASDKQMSPLMDGRELSGWMYRGANGAMTTFLKEQVINLRLPNPGDPDSLDGVPPWKAAKTAAESAVAAGQFSKRTMDQNGDRGMIVVVEGGAPTPEQRMAFIQELRERRRAAARGEFRDSIFGGNVRIESPTLSAISADFRSQAEMTREEIFVTFGVPPSMASKAASYSVGAASDWYRLITGPCMKEARALASAVARVSDYLLGNRSLAREIAGSARATGRCYAEFDFSNHPVMATVREERVKSLKDLVTIGVPVSVGNEFLAMGLPEFDGWDERLLPMSLQPVGTDEPTPDPAPAKGADLETLVRQWSAKRRGLSEAAKQKARLDLWKQVDGARNADRAKVKKVVTKHLMKARAETLANLAKVGDSLPKSGVPDAEMRAGVFEIVFNVANWATGLWNDLGSVIGAIFGKAGKQAQDEIGDETPGDFDPMDETDPRVIQHLRTRQNLIRQSSDEIHQDLIRSLEEGLQEGETLDQLTARVREVFTGLAKHKAEVIARTETGAAYETARYLTFKSAGIQKKGWLSGGEDGVTRETHQAADGQSRGIDEFFEVGAARLLHPHDHANGAAHPEELINCRCVLTAEA
jgi:hypothetical protein